MGRPQKTWTNRDVEQFEALCKIQCSKPLWDKTAGNIAVAEIVSMGIGVVIAVLAKINFLAGVVEVTQPLLLYVLYALTGVALGRGPSFVHDLWGKIRNNITSE